MARDLSGKRILITGGASGIGLESARMLAARGAELALVDIDGEGAEQAAAALGGRSLGLRADVTDAGALGHAFDRAREALGGLDVVFANAGTTTVSPASFAATSAEVFDRVIEVDLMGVIRTARASIEPLRESGGYLLLNASLSAVFPIPLQLNYSCAKAAVEGLARGLRIELAGSGIAVGVTVFGFIDTPMVRRGFSDPIGMQAKEELMPGFVSRSIPVERAAAVVVRGMERRAAVVVAPGWVRGALALRGLLVPAMVARGFRQRGIAKIVAQAEQRPPDHTSEAEQAAGVGR